MVDEGSRKWDSALTGQISGKNFLLVYLSKFESFMGGEKVVSRFWSMILVCLLENFPNSRDRDWALQSGSWNVANFPILHPWQ